MLLRLFLGAQSQTAAQSAAGLANAYNRQGPPPQAAAPVWQQTSAASVDQSGFGQPAGAQSSEEGGNWFIPADFDTQTFLQEAKKHFVAIQKVWDTGDIEQLRNFLTDDLLKALQGQFDGRQGVNQTEVVLLNAEMLGMEKVTDGHLASVRFSGMLREQPQSEAFRFEEVWNLFKPEQGGWLLAGIQQIPLSMAS